MKLEVTDFTYASGKPYVYQNGDQLPINFGLIPIDLDFEITDGINYLNRIKPTLWKNIYIGRNEDCMWVPVLRILDKNFIDNGKVIYQKIKSFDGLC